MINNKRVYAIILMREGSERVPDKCVKELNGKPLFQYTVDKLKKVSYIDDIIVSTSSERYKKIVADYGCSVLNRPDRLSESSVPNLPVYQDIVKQLKDELNNDDYIIHVDICKPFTTVKAIKKVVEVAEKEGLDTCFTCKEFDRILINEKATTRHDNIDSRYIHWNAARLFTVNSLKKKNQKSWGIGNKHEFVYDCVRRWEIDIDYNEDWLFAESLLKGEKK
jgi:CMP-N-acetylneuraminic acid synthetase